MLLNNELELNFPEGFHDASLDQFSGAKKLADGPGVFLSDPERHAVISVGWKKAGMLVGLILSQDDIVGTLEKSIRQANAPYHYTSGGRVERPVGSETAKGIRYEYVVDDVEMVGESLAVKRKKAIYYFHLYTRKTLEAENLALWEEILKSGRWS